MVSEHTTTYNLRSLNRMRSVLCYTLFYVRIGSTFTEVSFSREPNCVYLASKKGKISPSCLDQPPNGCLFLLVLMDLKLGEIINSLNIYRSMRCNPINIFILFIAFYLKPT